MKLAEVVTLYEHNASDICAMLRQAADSIETEAEEGFCPTKAIVAVQVSEDGEVKIYGWGQTDKFHSIGLLTIGAHKLADCIEAD